MKRNRMSWFQPRGQTEGGSLRRNCSPERERNVEELMDDVHYAREQIFPNSLRKDFFFLFRCLTGFSEKSPNILAHFANGHTKKGSSNPRTKERKKPPSGETNALRGLAGAVAV